MKFIKNWLENRKQIELEKERENAIETIMYVLLKDKETEESVELFSIVSNRFENLLKERRERIIREQEVIEKVLKNDL